VIEGGRRKWERDKSVDGREIHGGGQQRRKGRKEET